MSKILIIGQAPPAGVQEIPYDSTLLYDMLSWVGISVEDAQEMFIFDAVYDKFPGYTYTGGHKIPTQEMMDDYWNRSLREKIKNTNNIVILGKVANNYIYSKFKEENIRDKQVIILPHPSKRNRKIVKDQKPIIINRLKKLLNDNS